MSRLGTLKRRNTRSSSVHSPTHLTEPRTAEEPPNLPVVEGGGYFTASKGQVLNSKYTIIQKLGWGQHSTVWLARCTETQNLVAIKVLSRYATILQGKGTYERDILRHIRDVAKTSQHAGRDHVIVLLDDFEVDSDFGTHVCFVTEVVGTSVLSLREMYGKRIPQRPVKEITRQLLLALDFLHRECRVIHTDVKPDNMHLAISDIESVVTAEKHDNPLTQSHPISSVTREELDDEGWFSASMSVKLGDFSSAALFDGPHSEVIQPVALRAPEVILKCGWGSEVDIWSLGCIVSLYSLSFPNMRAERDKVFELMTGKWLFNPRGGASYTSEQYQLAHMPPIAGERFDIEVVKKGRDFKVYFYEDGDFRLVVEGARTLGEALSNYQVIKANELDICVDFMHQMLRLDPAKRGSALELLDHDWLQPRRRRGIVAWLRVRHMLCYVTLLLFTAPSVAAPESQAGFPLSSPQQPPPSPAMRFLSCAAAVAASSALWSLSVSAQVLTNATCLSNSKWTYNSLGQTPCLIAAYLDAQCNNGQWTVWSLGGTDWHYNPPENTSANPCGCSTVVYSMLQACAYCQGSTIGTWSAWIVNCPTIYAKLGYPYAVPPGTTIPAWAFLDPRLSGAWDATTANAYAVSPSGSITPNVSGASATPAPASSSQASPTTSSSSTSASPTSSSSNIGPIVGGAIGGTLGGLAILSLVIFFIWKSMKKDTASHPTPPAAPFGQNNGGVDAVPWEGRNSGLGPAGAFMGPEKPPGTPSVVAETLPLMRPIVASPFRPYDPLDPSTYAGSPQSASDPASAVGFAVSPSHGPTSAYPDSLYGGSTTSGGANPANATYYNTNPTMQPMPPVGMMQYAQPGTGGQPFPGLIPPAMSPPPRELSPAPPQYTAEPSTFGQAMSSTGTSEYSSSAGRTEKHLYRPS
ncbi:hypothetical protein FRB99_007036 [Tulasnella sp. 403]|nr:hypothetical protein FRB99_007036 [Tulasnella sp. 403]